MFDKWVNQNIAQGSLTLLYMVNALNCALIALMLFTLTLGDSYLPILAYSCFPITTAPPTGAHLPKPRLPWSSAPHPKMLPAPATRTRASRK